MGLYTSNKLFRRPWIPLATIIFYLTNMMRWLDDSVSECALAEVKSKFSCIVYQSVSPSGSFGEKAETETVLNIIKLIWEWQSSNAKKFFLFLIFLIKFVVSWTVDSQHISMNGMTPNVISVHPSSFTYLWLGCWGNSSREKLNQVFPATLSRFSFSIPRHF